MVRRGIYAGERDARDRYPVEPGDWWAVGPHLFHCGDVTEGAARRVIRAVGGPDVIWTDPPWSAGQGNMYRTIAGRTDSREFSELLGALVTAWRFCRGDVWVVMGTGVLTETVNAVRKAGGAHLGEWPLDSPHPCALLLFRFTRGISARSLLLGADGRKFGSIPRQMELTRLCMSTMEPGALVADFCLGLGNGPVEAARAGLRFAGCELSPGRMARALERTAEIAGRVPLKVDAKQSLM